MILGGKHNQPQFRHWAAVGLKINRFDKQQGVFERKNQKVSSNHGGSLLIPQAELRGQVRVLIDTRLDLQGTVHESRLRKTIGAQGSVLVAITASGQPADQIVPV